MDGRTEGKKDIKSHSAWYLMREPHGVAQVPELKSGTSTTNQDKDSSETDSVEKTLNYLQKWNGLIRARGLKVGRTGWKTGTACHQ